MFNALLSAARSGLDAVRKNIVTADTLRSLLATQTLCGAAPICAKVTELTASTPASTDWRVYDHCAALTRLYSLYEKFVEDLLSEWMAFLQTSVKYTDFDQKFKDEHRRGVGALLLSLDHKKHSSLTPQIAIEGFYNAVSGAGSYSIIPQALLAHTQNLRMSELVELFARCSLPNANDWIAAHRIVREFFSVASRESDTAEAELRSFVERRNEAAHGVPSDVLGRETLLEYVDFIDSICQVLAELASWHVLEKGPSSGSSRQIAKCTHHYKHAFVAMVQAAKVKVGDQVYFRGKGYCYSSRIVSLQVNNVDHNEVQVLAPTEVGFKCDVKPQNFADIFVMLSVSAEA